MYCTVYFLLLSLLIQSPYAFHDSVLLCVVKEKVAIESFKTHINHHVSECELTDLSVVRMGVKTHSCKHSVSFTTSEGIPLEKV